LCPQNTTAALPPKMYCIHRLLPPSVFHNVLMVHCRVTTDKARPHFLDDVASVSVVVQGTTLRASIASITRGDGSDVAQVASHASSCSTLIGSMPLALVATAESTVLLLTEDHHIVLLQVVCSYSEGDDHVGGEEAAHTAADSSEVRKKHGSWQLSFQLIMNTFVPMEALINRPPTVETNNPTLCASPDGSIAALQSYRGWVHIIRIDRALAGACGIDAVVMPIQLEKTKLADACFLPLASPASTNDPVFVPVFERPLQTVKGYFVNRKSPLGKPPTLVNAIRRWHLSGLPYKVLSLSPLITPTRAPHFSLLDVVDTQTHVLYAFSVGEASHHIAFSSLIARKVTQRTPHAIVDMVEVAYPDARGSAI
jgi:hypothetical protein